MPWRTWLIDWPARFTDVGFALYRLYLLIVLMLAGPVLLLTVLASVALWYGFGIRWGW